MYSSIVARCPPTLFLRDRRRIMMLSGERRKECTGQFLSTGSLFLTTSIVAPTKSIDAIVRIYYITDNAISIVYLGSSGSRLRR
jgi:hypothetical protein